jgi:hypothetical protein
MRGWSDKSRAAVTKARRDLKVPVAPLSRWRAPSVHKTHSSAASRARSLSAIAAVLDRFSSELAALGVGHDGVMLTVLQGGGPELLQP